ncbi:MAG: acyl-CoA dehydratase activase-related protein, partial [Coriobacteriales bacterium]|nr:acyl-CoA dehydratase activase-related protein [Coriobacteriales bacterium]
MTYRLGIDAGSKTIKLVILDERGKPVLTQYNLHRSDILTTLAEMLRNTLWRFGDAEVVACVTGSAGMRLAEVLDLPFVQEVVCTRHALEQLYPQVDAAIELGGEDAKILFLRNGVEQRMNGSCAGGTGGFIDVMCGMLGVRAREFNALASGYQTIYPIASRCAVFAQTDVRPLINEGARRSDIAASVLQAVVTQTVAGLSCGRRIEGTVAFLGGPLEVYPQLLQRFRQTLGLSFAQTIKPPDAHLFVAQGAALLAGAPPVSLQELAERLAVAPREDADGIARLAPLFADEQEREAFRQRHAAHAVERRRLMNHEGPLYLGIDAGSTTLKLVAIDDEGAILYSSYARSGGNVVAALSEALDEFYAVVPREYNGAPLAHTASALVTGYGEQMLRRAFCVDDGEVETICHLRAATEFVPDADFVLDIGGQDIKCLRVRGGQVDDIMLNEACSSGCGSLVEGFSRSLGYTKWTFSDIACQAERPVDLGTRCTVFMTSRVRHAQKAGVPAADIAAGLAYSVVRNALYKVIGCATPAQLGKRVVVQGGTFMSDAVLRAFELESGLEVVRPDVAHLMGAYGAALLARDRVRAAMGAAVAAATGAGVGEAEVADAAGAGAAADTGAGAAGTEVVAGTGAGAGSGSTATAGSGSAADSEPQPLRSTLLDRYQLAALQNRQSTQRCAGCTNACLLTLNNFTLADQDADEATPEPRPPYGTRVFVSGNRCERGAELYGGATDDSVSDADDSGAGDGERDGDEWIDGDSLNSRRDGDLGSRAPANLFALEQALLKRSGRLGTREAAALAGECEAAGFGSAGSVDGADGIGRATVGIPNTLDLYESYPFWRVFFCELGRHRLIIAQPSSGQFAPAPSGQTTPLPQVVASLPQTDPGQIDSKSGAQAFIGASLGCDVLPFMPSSSALYRKGAHAVMSEGVCYPAKLTHGHVADLIERGASHILMPTGGAVQLPGLLGALQAPAASQCPVSREYARLIASDVQSLSEGSVRFMTCDMAEPLSALPEPLEPPERSGRQGTVPCRRLPALLTGSRPLSTSAPAPLPLALLEQRLAAMLADAGFPQQDTGTALQAAVAAQQAFYEQLWQRAEAELARLERTGGRGILLAGHPYHNDAGLSHGIDVLLTNLGFSVFSLLSLKRTIAGFAAQAVRPERGASVADQWQRTAELALAARFVAAHPNLEFVQLHSFGCGIDALALDELRAILEDAGKLYTVLKVDEMVDLAAVRIRLRSLKAALRARQSAPKTGRAAAVPAARAAQSARVVEESVPRVGADAVLLSSGPSAASASEPSAAPVYILPALIPASTALATTALRERGHEVVLLPEIDRQDVVSGQLHCNNDLCYHLISVLGQVIRWAESLPGGDDRQYVLLVPQSCMACRGASLEAAIADKIAATGTAGRGEVRGLPLEGGQKGWWGVWAFSSAGG